MRWRGNRQSNNIEDRRAQRSASIGGRGGGMLLRLLPVLFRILGIKGHLNRTIGGRWLQQFWRRT